MHVAGQFRISLDFQRALARLSSEDQRRVTEALSKAMADFRRGGLRLHKVGNFDSLSPSMDLRVIAWRSGDTLTLTYVDHHDPAYAWAERNEAVIGDDGELLEIVQVAHGPSRDAEVAPQRTTPGSSRFTGLPESLLRWLGSIDDEDELLEVIASLAPEYQEVALAGATLERSTGEPPSDVVVLADDAALRDALAQPAATWRVFLHPRQRHLVTMPNDRHVLVRGGPGTGKTVTLVHRYARLYREALWSGGPAPVFVALTRSSRNVIRNMLAQLGTTLDVDDLLIAGDLGRSESVLQRVLRRYSAVLVDEGQDLPTPVIAHLLALLERRADVPPTMIAFDANQAIVNPTGDALGRLAALTDTVTLTYCYRSTRQVVDAAQGLLAGLEAGYTGKNFQVRHAIAASRDRASAGYVTALSGPDVEHVKSSLDEAPATVERLLARLQRTYPPNALAVIVVDSEQERGLSTLAAFKRIAVEVAVLRPIDAKSLEFSAGIVVDLIEQASQDRDYPVVVSEARYRALSGLYVGLTRFRDRAVVVTTSARSPFPAG